MAEIVKEGYILKNKYYADNKCNKCHTISKVELQELERGEYGEYFYICPYCGEKVKVDRSKYPLLDDIMIDDIKFPNDFHIYTEDKYDLSDGKVTEKLRELLQEMRDNRNTIDIITQTIDDTLFVIARNEEKERYDVFIGKNFYHTFVNYRGWDYITEIENKVNSEDFEDESFDE